MLCKKVLQNKLTVNDPILVLWRCDGSILSSASVNAGDEKQGSDVSWVRWTVAALE